MILKGSQRASGADLATHLMNAFDNEHVEIAELSGAVAGDLHGAFAEFEAVAAGTRAKEYLYSLSINPSAPLTRDEYSAAIQTIEDRLGLSGQPRAVVFHVKRDKQGKAREHCHVVWSRIDVDRMRAIHMAHDHRRLCDLSCELAHRYGLDLPPGLQAWEKNQRFEKERLEPTLAENAQAANTGISPEQRSKEITGAYEQSDSAASFRAALLQKGYVLAQGDQRGFVVVDKFAHVHSLSRYIDGHTARQIKKKLAPLVPEDLPGADEAKEMVRRQRKTQGEGQGDKARALIANARQKARSVLAKRHAVRRTALIKTEQELFIRQASEKLTVHAAQQCEAKGLLFRVRSAVADLIGRMPGLRSVLGHLQKLTHLDPTERHALERTALASRHEREKQGIERQKRGLAQIEARETQSLERALHRAAHTARAAHHNVRQDFSEAARDPVMRKRTEIEDGDLTINFNDTAEFVEGVDRGGDDDDDAPGWKSRAGKVRRENRAQRGKGRGRWRGK